MIQQQNTISNLRILLTVLMIVFISYYGYSNREGFKAIREINKIDLVCFSIFLLLASVFNAAQNAVLIRSLGVPFSDLESFGLSNISALTNLIVPQGVTVTKAVYLKHRHGVSYSKFSALFLGLLVIFLLIGALLMAVTNMLAMMQGIEVPIILWGGALLAGATTLLFFFDAPKAVFSRFGRVGALVGNFSDGWNQIRTNKSCLLKACLLQIAIFISLGLSVTFAYHSLGIDISPVLGVSLAVFIAFSNLIAIVPGNLGIQETVYGYLTFVSGLLFVQGIVISMMMRAVGLAITLMIAPISWYFLFFRHSIRLS